MNKIDKIIYAVKTVTTVTTLVVLTPYFSLVSYAYDFITGEVSNYFDNYPE